MNTGFASLTYLKAQLLAEALRAGTEYDAALTLLGQGVAAQFEDFCNRKFARVVGDTYTVSADRNHLYVPRYPVESVSGVELKTSSADGFLVQPASTIVNTNLESGFVYFSGELGPFWAHLRVTYTGGYWWDITEDGSDSLPSGATAVPEHLRLAWVLQCKEVWNQNDKLGVGLTAEVSKTPTFAKLDLVPQVKSILSGLIRYAIT